MIEPINTYINRHASNGINGIKNRHFDPSDPPPCMCSKTAQNIPRTSRIKGSIFYTPLKGWKLIPVFLIPHLPLARVQAHDQRVMVIGGPPTPVITTIGTRPVPGHPRPVTLRIPVQHRTNGKPENDPMALTDKILADLAKLMDRASERHGPIASNMETLGVITEEYHEVIGAVHRGESWAIRAELFDLAVAALRGVVAIDQRKETNHEDL